MKLILKLNIGGKNLKEELKIPDHVRSFSVHFTNNDFVVVECTYEPEDGKKNHTEECNAIAGVAGEDCICENAHTIHP